MTSVSVGDVLPNSFDFNFYGSLGMNSYNENLNNNIRPLSIPDTPPKPTFQIAENTSRDIINTGNQIYQNIPYDRNNSRFQSFYKDGRKLQLLETIKYNQKPSYPTSYTAYPLNKIGNV